MMGRMKEIGGMLDLFGERPGQIASAPIPSGETLEDLEGCPREVAYLFERIAMELHRSGRKSFSSDAILHRIRWYHHVERGDDSFKCNNNWTAVLARWFVHKHPECGGFFELRIRKSQQAPSK